MFKKKDAIVVGCSHGLHLAEKIATRLGITYSPLEVKKFPDSETYLRFNFNPKNKIIILVQSFYGVINDCIIEVLFAAETARELKAKKVILVAPYFPYLRQDRRFREGECISLKTIAKNIDEDFDMIYVIDPHLHREKKLSNIFKIKTNKITSVSLISDYIKQLKKANNKIVIGPDEESYKWAGAVAKNINAGYIILKKHRKSAYDVSLRLNKNINLKDRFIVIVDDIISTGSTIIETVKLLRKLGGKNFLVICVHGIFAKNSLAKLRKHKVDVLACNTIPSKVAKIDVSELISKSISKLFQK